MTALTYEVSSGLGGPRTGHGSTDPAIIADGDLGRESLAVIPPHPVERDIAVLLEGPLGNVNRTMSKFGRQVAACMKWRKLAFEDDKHQQHRGNSDVGQADTQDF